MNFTPNRSLFPVRDGIPLKAGDQNRSQPEVQRCDAQVFKVPFPYKSQSEFKINLARLPEPEVPANYQPWVQTCSGSGSQSLPTVWEYQGWSEWRHVDPLQYEQGLRLGHQNQSFSINRVPDYFHRLAGEFGSEPKTLSDKRLRRQKQRNKQPQPYVKRTNISADHFPCPSPSLLETRLPRSREELALHTSAKLLKSPASGSSLHSFVKDSPHNSSTPATEGASGAPVRLQEPQRGEVGSSERASSSRRGFPWLIPHFMAGSLIELRDGRLRRVEHLQTEDFLLGSLACPDLRLSCCTVQSISHSTSSISRLLILLHDQQSQELVDVYEEYPFFVHGHGWSSCSPQRTARLCGLQCRQLSVGDVCLALTPVPTLGPH